MTKYPTPAELTEIANKHNETLSARPMRKYILVNFCGDCPYSDASGRDKSWYCMEPTQLDSYEIGARLGDNSRETLDNIPDWCPLEDDDE